MAAIRNPKAKWKQVKKLARQARKRSRTKIPDYSYEDLRQLAREHNAKLPRGSKKRIRTSGSAEDIAKALGIDVPKKQSNAWREGRAKAEASVKHLQVNDKTQKRLSETLNKSNDSQVKGKKKELALDTEIKVRGNVDELMGRKSTTIGELAAIGIRKKDAGDTELGDKELMRINLIRNGYDSYEAFLNSDPREHEDKDLAIFSGERVGMNVVDNGSVEFGIDGKIDSHKVGKDRPKPTAELIQMARSWENYANSPAGSRILRNTPHDEGTENSKFESRKKAYEGFGFKARKEYSPWGDGGVIEDAHELGQVLDNRRPGQEISDVDFLTEFSSTASAAMSNASDRRMVIDKMKATSPEQKRAFLKLKTTDEMMDWFGVKLSQNWQKREENESSLVTVFKSLKAAEMNLKEGNVKVTSRNFISLLREQEIRDVFGDMIPEKVIEEMFGG